MSISVRRLEPTDKEQWQDLFAQYQKFYRAEIPAGIVENTWGRLVGESSNINAFVAVQNDVLVGITHLVFHESTWSNRDSCYIEDLFVTPTARGSGAAEMLIRRVEKFAREHLAFRLYWHTQEYNGAARSLYDTIMPRSSFIVYRKSLS